MSDGRTHWEGCYKEYGHKDCAIAQIERLTADLNESERQTRAQLKRVLQRDERIAELEANLKLCNESCGEWADENERLQARAEALEETLIEVLVDNGRTRDEAQHIADLATGGVSEWFWER